MAHDGNVRDEEPDTWPPQLLRPSTSRFGAPSTSRPQYVRTGSLRDAWRRSATARIGMIVSALGVVAIVFAAVVNLI